MNDLQKAEPALQAA
jgi:dynein heavy chain